MNNLKELMKEKTIKINKKEKSKIVSNVTSVLKEKALIIVIEEISELINVISDNIDGKTDYLHTCEEVVDVMICVNFLKDYCNIKDSKLEDFKKKDKVKKSIIFSILSDLSKSQQYISKYLRHGDNAQDKVIVAINMLNESLYYTKALFKIKSKDISKMEGIKYNRLKERFENNELR